MRRTTLLLLAAVLGLGLAEGADAGSPGQTGTAVKVVASTPQDVDVDVSSTPGVRLALADLPRGASPRVPWIKRRTLHVGDQAVTLPRVRTAFAQYERRVVPYGAGALMQLSDYRKSLLVTIDAAGRVVRRRPGMALASTADGRIAWWNTRTGTAVIADSAGQVVRRVTVPGTHHGHVYVTTVGWLAAGDVVFRIALPGGSAYLWSTRGEDLQAWRDAAFATSRAQQLVAAGFWGGTGPDNECTLVWAVGAERPLWRRCFWRGDMAYWSGEGEFSPDGRLLLVTGGSQTSGARPFHALLDARTGELVARFDHGRYGDDRVAARYEVRASVFEDDQHVLFVVSDRTGQALAGTNDAIVRCDVTASCELATRPRQQNRQSLRPAYALAR